MFDVCLAPSANGSGVGCDNVSCVIIDLNPLRCRTTERAGDDDSAQPITRVDVVSTKRSYADATCDVEMSAQTNDDRKRVKLDEGQVVLGSELS